MYFWPLYFQRKINKNAPQFQFSIIRPVLSSPCRFALAIQVQKVFVFFIMLQVPFYFETQCCVKDEGSARDLWLSTVRCGWRKDLNSQLKHEFQFSVPHEVNARAIIILCRLNCRCRSVNERWPGFEYRIRACMLAFTYRKWLWVLQTDHIFT